MKIFVFSDLHGSTKAMESILCAIQKEQPQKVVFCGDLFGGSGTQHICDLIKQIDAVLYLVRGNNDIFYRNVNLPCEFEEYAVMYHFDRTLFFTHGHIYNGRKTPSFLGNGDVVAHGHTHVTRLYNYNGLNVVNVGSCALPRDKTPCYVILDETGATQKSLDGQILSQYNWE